MAKKGESELLKRLNARAAWNLPPFRQPKWNAADLRSIEDAAQLHAKANASDPFAYSRMKRHLLRGLDSAADVSEEARRLLGLRQSSALQDAA